MKKTPMFISALAVSCLMMASCNQNAQTTDNTISNEETTVTESCNGKIAFVDLDILINEYDMANDLRSVVETKVQGIQSEVTRRRTKLESEAKAFQEKIDKGLMTRSTAEIQAQKLQQKEQEFNEFAGKKQQEVMEEQQVMMNQIGDAIKTFLEAYNIEAGYTMIIANQMGLPVLTADPSVDITKDVLAGLNEEYIQTKNKKN